jgi:eukaryotic-like serine/threonine-protein kinase
MTGTIPERLATALADRYRVERELGAGGMATVYLAHDLKHERDVAIKVLHPDLGAALGAERFLSEIKTTAKLQHPHILPLLDSGAADGLLYYVMPFVDGETLRARLERETQLPIADAVRLAREVADALQYAHTRGIVHRDIKPDNILLHEGHALVADFGIALAVQQAGGQRMTQTGLSLGTPQYMSPEQATGEKVVDARADLYALGAVTYEMLVGEPPFTGPSTQAIVARLLTNPPAPLSATRSTIAPHIESAVLTALAKLPADRQTSVAEFAAQLTGAAPVAFTPLSHSRDATGTAAASRASDGPDTARVLRRTRMLLGVAVMVAVGALSAMGWLITRPLPITPTRTFVVPLPDSTSLFEAGLSRRVALTRDGRRVIFSGGSTANFGLFSRDLGDTLVRRILGTERGGSPVLCPDGRWLYFVRSSQGTWRVSTEGGQPTLVVDSASVTDCNAANDVLLVRSGRLWLWREGQPLRLIVAPDITRGEFGVNGGAFLPGGTHVTFSVRRVGESITGSVLATAPLSGGATTLLGVTGLRPRWSNGYLLFVRAGDLVAAPFDPKRRKLLGEALPVVRNVATRLQGSDFDVSDDGTLVYVGGSYGSQFRLTRVDRAGREELLDREAALYSWPRLSPDGQRVAVEVQAADNAGFDVWLFTLASRSLERLTNGYSGVRPLAWSDDGQRVAYLTVKGWATAQATRTITWVPADLSSPPQLLPVRIPNGTQVEDATLRGTTEQIVVRSRGYGAPGDLWVVSPPPPGDSVRPARPFVVTDADEETPRLSPDGRWVAYASNETGRFEVYARATDGSGGRIPLSAGPGAEPVWSPDGRGLYYRGDTRVHFVAFGNGPTLEVVRRDTLFADGYRRETLAVSYDVFPDGRSLLMQKPAGLGGRSPIVVLNWPSLLRERARSGAR